MSVRYQRVCAMLFSVSVVSLLVAEPAIAQTAPTAASTEQSAKPKQAKRKRAAAKPAMTTAEASAILNARAQAGPRGNQQLDEITIAASKVSERAIDALAPVSVITLEEIQRRQATRIADLVYTTPGVWIQDRGDDPSTSINIRGLQDFGRVAVVVDGARQNYQRTGHNANGSFFLDPELVGGIDIVRGPTANIYGSGAIGGVASFRTKDIQDVVRPGERWGVDTNTIGGTNNGRFLQSIFGGVHVNPNVDIFAGGSYARQDNYRDGYNTTVENTFNDVGSAIGKLTLRPADGHEVKLSGIFQDYKYTVGQPRRPVDQPFGQAGASGTGTSNYATDVKTYQASLGWKYSEPSNKLFDWDSKIYWNRTDQDQTKTLHTSTANSAYCGGVVPGNAISGCVGDKRGYILDTYGFDFNNTTRLEGYDWRHAFTYGADAFRDEVNVTDSRGNSNVTTPSGNRTVSGGFVQWKANYTSLAEIISAVRYDNYQLRSATTSAGGDRFSPKITVGLMPQAVLTPYVSYAEGYRAPSVTETLITGAHVSPGGPTYVCPDGNPGMFCFLPNPNLRPEVGKNKEVGLNIKKNDIFKSGDSFRGKLSAFRNDVEDYIDFVNFFAAPVQIPLGLTSYYQYQNIPGARIQGFEFETMYDAQSWFVGVSGTFQDGVNKQTNIGLYSIAPQKITTTAGVRFADNKGSISATWTSIKSNTNIPVNYLPATSYELVNMYLTYMPTPVSTLSFSVENLLNQYYRPYAIPRGSPADVQNDVLWASAGPGIVFKGGFKYHFGGI